MLNWIRIGGAILLACLIILFLYQRVSIETLRDSNMGLKASISLLEADKVASATAIAEYEKSRLQASLIGKEAQRNILNAKTDGTCQNLSDVDNALLDGLRKLSRD